MSMIITVVAWQFPLGRYIVYPFTMLGTWFHEMGHGITAMILGGTFHNIEISLRAGGIATSSLPAGSSGFSSALVSMGGLLGPAIAGSILIMLGKFPRVIKPTLLLLSCVMIGSTLWLGITSLGMWIIAATGAGIMYTTLKANDFVCRTLLLFLSAQAGVSVFQQLDYLFAGKANVAGKVMDSDVSVIADNLFLPVVVWGSLLTVATFAMIVGSLYVSYKGVFSAQVEKAAQP